MIRMYQEIQDKIWVLVLEDLCLIFVLRYKEFPHSPLGDEQC